MAATPMDANATRGSHLRVLVRHPVAITATVVAVALAGAITGVFAGLGPGLGAAAGAFLLAALVLFVIADARAAEDFFKAYAASRSLTTGAGRGFLPPATSLLRKGLRRYSRRAFAGRLDGRVDGLLAHYTYETETTDSKGNRHTQYHPFTVAMTAVPEATALLSQCACQRRAGFRFFDKAEDAFRNRQRVELESEELDRRYEIFIGEYDDQNRARQLFSPVFIDWLATGDDDMGWELENGMLVVNIPGHKDAAEELDAVSAVAATVTERISEEAKESPAQPAADRPEPPAFDPGSYVVAETESSGTSSVKKGLGLLFTLLCIAGGIAFGFATSDSGDSESGYDSSGVDYGSATLAAQDDILLPLVLRLDRGKGVHTNDLYGHGVPPDLVDDWIADAFIRSLITFSVKDSGFKLTTMGEREAKRAG